MYPIVSEMFGGGLATANISRSSTLTNRIHSNICTLKQLCWRSTSKHLKAQAVRAHAQSKALYGCETSRPADNALNKYNSKILGVITYKGGNISADLAFNVASKGDDIDPHTNILVRRVATIRMMIAKDPALKTILDVTFKVASVQLTNPTQAPYMLRACWRTLPQLARAQMWTNGRPTFQMGQSHTFWTA